MKVLQREVLVLMVQILNNPVRQTPEPPADPGLRVRTLEWGQDPVLTRQTLHRQIHQEIQQHPREMRVRTRGIQVPKDRKILKKNHKRLKIVKEKVLIMEKNDKPSGKDIKKTILSIKTIYIFTFLFTELQH